MWLAVKDSLTHRPSSQRWAPGVLLHLCCLSICVSGWLDGFLSLLSLILYWLVCHTHTFESKNDLLYTFTEKHVSSVCLDLLYVCNINKSRQSLHKISRTTYRVVYFYIIRASVDVGTAQVKCDVIGTQKLSNLVRIVS